MLKEDSPTHWTLLRHWTVHWQQLNKRLYKAVMIFVLMKMNIVAAFLIESLQKNVKKREKY